MLTLLIALANPADACSPPEFAPEQAWPEDDGALPANGRILVRYTSPGSTAITFKQGSNILPATESAFSGQALFPPYWVSVLPDEELEVGLSYRIKATTDTGQGPILNDFTAEEAASFSAPEPPGVTISQAEYYAFDEADSCAESERYELSVDIGLGSLGEGIEVVQVWRDDDTLLHYAPVDDSSMSLRVTSYQAEDEPLCFTVRHEAGDGVSYGESELTCVDDGDDTGDTGGDDTGDSGGDGADDTGTEYVPPEKAKTGCATASFAVGWMWLVGLIALRRRQG